MHDFPSRLGLDGFFVSRATRSGAGRSAQLLWRRGAVPETIGCKYQIEDRVPFDGINLATGCVEVDLVRDNHVKAWDDCDVLATRSHGDERSLHGPGPRVIEVPRL